MKTVLVVDESRAVRETLALILGREFRVLKRPFLSAEEASPLEERIDLLILGLSPESAANRSFPVKVTSLVSCPVLFLLTSALLIPSQAAGARVDYLAKPFNPFELRQKIRRLLFYSPPAAGKPDARDPGKGLARYLEFPYFPETVSALAKRYALAGLPLVLIGEMGSGHDRMAKGMYELSGESGPWITIHPSEIDEEYLLGRIRAARQSEGGNLGRATLYVNGLEGLNPSSQSSLLRFLEREEKRGADLWILSSSRCDLLERVYRGDFLDLLYYRLARLILRIPPLRERQEDLPVLVGRIVQDYSMQLGLGQVTVAQAALERLSGYLWFGNLSEMEIVLARTMATYRKDCIEADDLAFDLGEGDGLGPAAPSSVSVREEDHGLSKAGVENGAPDLRVLLYGLAHELKNPMVTIRTLAELLPERFHDLAFRLRFQGLVKEDIERMDHLLEDLLEFSRFSQPKAERLSIYNQLQEVLEGLAAESAKRSVTIRSERKEAEDEVFMDGAQLRYTLRNVLLTVFGQAKPEGEVQIEVEGESGLAILYSRDGGRVASLDRYLDEPLPSSEANEHFPLRLLLARRLLERNGGGLTVRSLEEGKVRIQVKLPVS